MKASSTGIVARAQDPIDFPRSSLFVGRLHSIPLPMIGVGGMSYEGA